MQEALVDLEALKNRAQDMVQAVSFLVLPLETDVLCPRYEWLKPSTRSWRPPVVTITMM